MRTSFSTFGRLIRRRDFISTTCWSRFGWIETPSEQRPQQRLRVDVDARARLVTIWNAQRDADADDRRRSMPRPDARSSAGATFRAAASSTC